MANLGPGSRLPYLASIRQPGSRAHICSGVLISNDTVLTAAHCIDDTSPYSAGRKPILHIGATSVDDVNSEVKVALVDESYIHPCWDHQQRSEYNVALLKLATATDKQFPVVLFDHFRLRTGQQLVAAGWGSGGEEISVGSDVFGCLKFETQEYIQQQHCNRPKLWNGTIPEGVFCALNDEQRASCLVDSGAPLLLLDQPRSTLSMGKPELDFLVGINIDGSPCGTPQKPDLFIDLAHIHSWIAEHTSK